jgi:hypothetical protein
MCRQFGQTCADEQENTRILLKIYEERNNHLVNVVSASNGLIVVILVGVLAFAGSVQDIEKKPFYIAWIVSIIVVSLFAWRLYARWVDEDIQKMYGKILCCEYKLNVESRTSLLLSLVTGLRDKSKKRELLDLIKSSNLTRAYNEMFLLLEEKKVGGRGQRWFDGIAVLLFVLSIVIGGFTIFTTLPVDENTIIGYVFGFLTSCLIIAIGIFVIRR